jgi:hypothetical protein
MKKNMIKAILGFGLLSLGACSRMADADTEISTAQEQPSMANKSAKRMAPSPVKINYLSYTSMPSGLQGTIRMYKLHLNALIPDNIDACEVKIKQGEIELLGQEIVDGGNMYKPGQKTYQFWYSEETIDSLKRYATDDSAPDPLYTGLVNADGDPIDANGNILPPKPYVDPFQAVYDAYDKLKRLDFSTYVSVSFKDCKTGKIYTNYRMFTYAEYAGELPN